jgi:hypothetical protein
MAAHPCDGTMDDDDVDGPGMAHRDRCGEHDRVVPPHPRHPDAPGQFRHRLVHRAGDHAEAIRRRDRDRQRAQPAADQIAGHLGPVGDDRAGDVAVQFGSQVLVAGDGGPDHGGLL